MTRPPQTGPPPPPPPGAVLPRVALALVQVRPGRARWQLGPQTRRVERVVGVLVREARVAVRLVGHGVDPSLQQVESGGSTCAVNESQSERVTAAASLDWSRIWVWRMEQSPRRLHRGETALRDDCPTPVSPPRRCPVAPV